MLLYISIFQNKKKAKMCRVSQDLFRTIEDYEQEWMDDSACSLRGYLRSGHVGEITKMDEKLFEVLNEVDGTYLFQTVEFDNLFKRDRK